MKIWIAEWVFGDVTGIEFATEDINAMINYILHYQGIGDLQLSCWSDGKQIIEFNVINPYKINKSDLLQMFAKKNLI